MAKDQHSTTSEHLKPIPAAYVDEGGSAPVSTLRGAGVEADVKVIAMVAGAFALVSLVLVSGMLFLAGARKNSEIEALRAHGTPVVMTVTGCIGLMGGSGSNAAGYQCTGIYTLYGHRHHANIPGDALHATGQSVLVLAVADDPGLVSSPRLVAAEQPSEKVYVVPSLLLFVAVLAGVVLVRRIRRPRRGGGRDGVSALGEPVGITCSDDPGDQARARTGAVDWNLS